MLKFLPFLLMIGYGLLMWRLSAMRLRHELDAKSVRLADPALEPVLERLAEAAGVERIPVRIYEVDVVNGLAAPDGRIFLTRGFYRRFRAGEVTDTELASVIAHEMGHVALGHARRRMIDFAGQNAVRMLLMTVLGRLIPGLGIWLADLVTGLVAARLSRGDEYEADRWASALLVKAGIGTAPQKALFRKLDRLTGARGAPPAWLMSHPKTAERIAAIEANEARWGLPQP
ncbi:M48 family metallopeptidase [Frigidibacter oleivorans]|uniref:M48 family metallopeptidase n=1 Tax=Frigidibacter oleivorans TaxID=2487129 RepID=UPI000F8DF8CD|nr:M48 family metallopeptidase [Frigidibacter oleivorans]